jgi:hypothetical protein
MKKIVFWDVTPSSLVEIDFRGAYCLHHKGDDDGDIKPSETLANFYETRRRNIPEDSHRQSK